MLLCIVDCDTARGLVWCYVVGVNYVFVFVVYCGGGLFVVVVIIVLACLVFDLL